MSEGDDGDVLDTSLLGRLSIPLHGKLGTQVSKRDVTPSSPPHRLPFSQLPIWPLVASLSAMLISWLRSIRLPTRRTLSAASNVLDAREASSFGTLTQHKNFR